MTALDAHQEERLRGQWATLSTLVGRASPGAFQRSPRPGAWTAGDILAHLGRYHEIFLERLRRILDEESPRFARYSAEEDEDWPPWQALSTDEVFNQLKGLREDVMAALTSLTAKQIVRSGVHPVLGEMPVGGWVEFFLLHEGRHLYTLLFLLHPVAQCS